ncbi:cullin-associated NEDD8-dissociated protein 1-like [Pyrus ussuriensis x Pyrus communis]|uniref:Cullin-associated NEDD8-dissociated protein 1-like n=1 Tax=Pyrus ussuriensis x Pyrus communis TaxID=2448454 RepID=A0A5N5F147_9ROSA|nr:cullin-associated NEDD8-dissociated protein 1-like [Pyrus ussuriensis x Pyrus communis]
MKISCDPLTCMEKYNNLEQVQLLVFYVTKEETIVLSALLPGIFRHCCFSTENRSVLCVGAIDCGVDCIPKEGAANRPLRQAKLGTLNSLIIAYGNKIGSAAYEVIIVELAALISDSDLHMTALALELCCTLMVDRSSPVVGLALRSKVLPQALMLIRSSLLQGQALSALQKNFASLVYSANTSFDAFLDSLLLSAKPSPPLGGVAKQALYSVAQCVAVLCIISCILT